MQPDERDQLIEQYQDGYRAVAEALLKITPEELDAAPAPGKWSARQIVHHLADSEMTGAVASAAAGGGSSGHQGLRPDRPGGCTTTGRTRHRSSFFRAARAATAELMAGLDETEWLREHAQRAGRRLDTWPRIYAPHAHRHADQSVWREVAREDVTESRCAWRAAP
jgi:hypothetical protein